MTETTSHIGHCHCGAVNLTIPTRPADLNTCNCSICTKNGGLWGYFNPADVVISGQTSGYVRRDMRTPYLTTHFCPQCGVVTHWSPLPNAHQNRMGINMRLFPAETTEGLQIQFHDGQSWGLDSEPE